jgi:hypothetical protein
LLTDPSLSDAVALIVTAAGDTNEVLFAGAVMLTAGATVTGTMLLYAATVNPFCNKYRNSYLAAVVGVVIVKFPDVAP